MDLFDILLVKKLIGKVNSGDITSPEAQEIMKQLEEKQVKMKCKTQVSTVDNNVWEPGAYGWDEVI